MGIGLALFERRIFFQEDVIGRNLFWLKVTRKSKAPNKKLRAGQIAALKWLVDKVRRVTGEVPHGAIADLAEVVLQTELTLDQVRAAHRARRHWQWMKPKLQTPARSRPK